MWTRIVRVVAGMLVLAWISNGCGPKRVETEKTFDSQQAMDLMQHMSGSIETVEPSTEDEGFVFNHFQNLWHYLRVSSNTTVTLTRVRYLSWTSERETVVGVFMNPNFGRITVHAEDQDPDEHQGVDIGRIEFSETVDFPEHGTAQGEIYPFGAEYQGVKNPPSLHLKLPGGYFVPKDGLLDWTKRYMKHEEAIDALRQLVRAVYETGRSEVPTPG